MTDSDPDLPDTEEETAPSAAELEAAGQDSMFGGDDVGATGPATPDSAETKAEPAPRDEGAQPYRVLARKYRPQTFSELVGQEPMVRTLANAIERDRLAHAFLMTGVRGVGKTSTARLIAKALNCVGPDGNGGPTIDPCGVCEFCTAIAEGRHIDVIEMDAASHTGVDDVREIIEQVRYAAVSARYKIYIIDEVHMLSRNAFNALLKTLEEPPAHVKFLFATTEVEKLPVTVLSRTQRFDLRRIPASLLAEHFGNVCKAEGVEAEEEALRIIAAAAEGSARDGLSILDQAIAHADMDTEGKVTAERVRSMLGLADKSAQRRLLGTVLEGDAKGLLAGVDEQYALGVEPLALMRALMDLVHRVTVAQVSGGEPDAPSEEERTALAEFASKLGAPELHRLWQLLLKGHEEVRTSPDPLVALQMALLRVLHAAQMPDPGKLAARIEEMAKNGVSAAPAETGGESAPAPTASSSVYASFEWGALVDQIDNAGQLRVAQMMRDRIRVIELAPEKLIFEQADNYSDDPAPDIRDALFKLTGKRWLVERGSGDAQPSLREAADAEAQATQDRIRANPLVKAAFEAFPDAELVDPEQTLARASGSGRKWN
ncbi:DNA polymerase III subunits gamma and tau [Erythrobacter sp. NAP1]|uniref:DNA polymerase III subunit gamma/tau n=1 Tax=Erythrobacter sp. NAP1 TaxID=237727 RepID=UPI0000686D59|nr:DNA polymerase III subunit gamma/tau [Erythrobacter sp. NAP1]EAQ29636.1 DNA polymerase III subunits gamma and tau [Erythrobacter sp. NAP1]